MKPTKILVPLFILVSLITCTHEEDNFTESLEVSDSFERNWQESNLSKTFFNNQKNISHYNFSRKDILRVLSTPNLTKLRFVLGYQIDQITMTMVGVNKKGRQVISIPSVTYLSSENYSTSIEQLKNSSQHYSLNQIQTPIVGRHLLPYNKVFSYITKWKDVLKTETTEEIITDNGIRYRYYTLEKEVLTDMVTPKNVESIALFLGLNAQNKLTTVFLQKNQNDELILNNNSFTNKERRNGNAYDFTEPCPNVCD